MISGEEYRARSFLLCSLLHSPVNWTATEAKKSGLIKKSSIQSSGCCGRTETRNRGTAGGFQAGEMDLSFLHSSCTGFKIYPTSCFPALNFWGMKLTTHLHLVSRLRIRVATRPLSWQNCILLFTSRKVVGSMEICQWRKPSDDRTLTLGIDSASDRNECQGYSLRIHAALTPLFGDSLKILGTSAFSRPRGSS